MVNRNPIRILFLITDLGRTGAERFLIDLCTELSKDKKIEFVIAPLFDNNKYIDETKAFKIVNLNFQTFSLRKKNTCIQYQELLKSFKPHVVHTHRFLAEFLSSYYLDPKIKYVCHCHDNMIQFKNFAFDTLFSRIKILNYLEKRYLVRKKYNKVRTYFIANSNDTKKYFEEVLPLNQVNNVRDIALGFNFKQFFYEEQREILNKSIKIINVASFLEKKNQSLIVDIASILNKRGVDFEINLLGDGVKRGDVEQKVKERGLEDKIHFRGIVDNVEEWMNDSDIYLHTAYYEPFGLVFLEAMASGLPIVTLNGKGNKDIVTDCFNGFIIDKEKPDIFADKIIEIMKSPELYNRLSNNGKEYCKKYDIKNKAQEYVEFYQTITSNKVD